MPTLSAEKLCGSSPHTRGARPPSDRDRRRRRIIPAYAGSTVAQIPGKIVKADHPRIRGEHPIAAKPDNLVMGSSPHTRGARADESRHRGRLRIIPAYAGSTSRPRRSLRGQQDHPRIRGEHPPGPAMYWPWPGSSPHTRGARAHGQGPGSGDGIIPAYAGSTSRPSRLVRAWRDHPRIRGEHLIDRAREKNVTGSSPHTRGAHRLHRPEGGQRRIIPAYAGSTSPSPTTLGWQQDHPRIRGEHGSSSATTI